MTMGRLWWRADSPEELLAAMRKLTSDSRVVWVGATDDGNGWSYFFDLPRECSEEILGYPVDDDEWLEEEYREETEVG